MRSRAAGVVAVRALLFTAVVACGAPDRAAPQAPPSPPSPSAAAAGTGGSRELGGLALPESAQWDERTDLYLVSNINGEPRAEDDNGTIVRIAPADGAVERWIDGASADVTLNAPRGMAFDDEVLYVADLSVVRRFDRRSGAQLPPWPIPGSLLLNDVVIAGGALYASDSGFPTAMQPPEAQHAIYRLPLPVTPSSSAVPAISTLLAAKDLGRPGGLALDGDTLWIVTYGSGELFSINLRTGARSPGERLPTGGLDGVVRIDGTFYITSWEGESLLAGVPGGPWRVLSQKLPGPADLGWDAKRRRLLIPVLLRNSLLDFPLPP